MANKNKYKIYLALANASSKILVLLLLNLFSLVGYCLLIFSKDLFIDLIAGNLLIICFLATVNKLFQIGCESAAEEIIRLEFVLDHYLVELGIQKNSKNPSYYLKFILKDSNLYYNYYFDTLNIEKILIEVLDSRDKILSWLSKQSRRSESFNLYPQVSVSYWINRYPQLVVKKARCGRCQSELETTIPFVNKYWLGLMSRICCQKTISVQEPRTEADREWYTNIHERFGEVLDSLDREDLV